MHIDEIPGAKPIRRHKRPTKKARQAGYKATWPPGYTGPTLLLRLVESTSAKGLTKLCTQCNKVKDLKEFYTNKKPGRPSMYRGECKKCSFKISHRSARKKRQERERQRKPQRKLWRREYYQRNKEKCKGYMKKMFLRDPDYLRRQYKNHATRMKKLTQEAAGALIDKDCS